MPHLRRIDDGTRFELKPEGARIGRAPENDIALVDTSVSRRHARVVVTEKGYLLVDEGSENGIFVGGQRVTNHFLRDGDVVQLGAIQLRFELQSPAPSRAPVPVPVPAAVPVPVPAAVPAPRPAPAPATPQVPPPPAIPASRPKASILTPILLVILVVMLFGGAVLAFVAFRFLRGPQSKMVFELKADRSVATIAPELAPLGPMTRVRVKPSVTEVSGQGAKVEIKDGSRLVVPEGAFEKPVKLETSVISMGLEHFDFAIRDSWAYVVKTVGDEKVEVKKTITLEIPYSPKAVRVTQLNGDTWQRIEVPPGPTTKVTIGHFSSKVFGVAKSNIVEEDEPALSGPVIQPSEPLPPAPGIEEWERQKREEQEKIERAKRLARERIENSNESTRRFYGVGEKANHSTAQNCSDLTAVLEDFKRDPKNFEVPPSFKDASCTDLGINWLFPGQIPSKETNNYYWREVAASMEPIKKAVLASDRPLTEAQVLRICIIANDGNVLKGILAAHNFLKDVTYKGRVYPNPGAPNVPDELGEIASHLESWRHDSNVSPAGEYDKMGPIYHLFAAATARAWCGAVWGSIAINGEAASRAFGTMGDKYDIEKGDADTCGRDLGAVVAGLLPTKVKGVDAPNPELWKFSPNPITGEKAPCPPSDVKSWSRRLCPWSDPTAGAEPCPAGFCWDGGFRGTLACKPEQEVSGGYRNDMNNILCPAGFHLTAEECTGIPKSCDPNE